MIDSVQLSGIKMYRKIVQSRINDSCKELTSSRNRLKSCCLLESWNSFWLEVNTHLSGTFLLKWPPYFSSQSLTVFDVRQWTRRPNGRPKTCVFLILFHWYSWQNASSLDGTNLIANKLQCLFVKMRLWSLSPFEPASRTAKSWTTNVWLHHPNCFRDL